MSFMFEEMEIRAADPTLPQVAHLIEVHTAYGDAHYSAESNHHVGADQHEAEGIQLFAAWQGDQCLGIAGLKTLDDKSGELKSMHVREDLRGKGVGKVLLDCILDQARREGLTRLYLETGSRDASAAARTLYEKLGFDYCPPFGTYQEDIESVFMVRSL